MEKNYSGGCLCSQIRFQATGNASVHLCSCDICQKHTGALTAAWAEFSADSVQWIGEGGRPSVWRSSPHSSRAFCPQCGSSLGAIDDAPTIALLVGTFDNPQDPSLVAEGHSFEDMAPEWWRQQISAGKAEQPWTLHCEPDDDPRRISRVECQLAASTGCSRCC